MWIDVVEVKALDDRRIFVRFADGEEGTVDVWSIVSPEGVFAPLRDPRRFAEVKVNAELGAVCWPGGADLDPEVLYSRVTGKPLPSESAPQPSALPRN